jgi:hypothetical protein
MRAYIPDRPGIDGEGNDVDVAAAHRADNWKRLGNPCERIDSRDAWGVMESRRTCQPTTYL